MRRLLSELRRRKVFPVAGVYLVASWGVVEVFTTVLPLLGAPEWLAQAVLALLAAGFPVAVALAWALDAGPGGLTLDATDQAVPDRHVRLSHAALFAGAAVVGLAIPVFLVLEARRPSTERVSNGGAAAAAPVEANRVTIFPFRTSPALDPALGEDVATVIAHALDGAGGLRSVDGWSVMSPDERADVRALTDERASALARSERSRFTVTGQVVALSRDTVEVVLRLYDLEADSAHSSKGAAGPASQVWRLGLRAVNQALPDLILEGSTRLDQGWDERDPAVIASFLQGEQQFRRSRYESALESFVEALTLDSTFALAALRAAQAVAWGPHREQASRFARLAVDQDLPPRFEHLARGFVAYYDGRPDEALVELHRVIALDPTMAIAWMQIGEVYRHLLPRVRRPDSLSAAAFREAFSLEPGSTESHYHLLEAALNRGDVETAEALRRELRESGLAPALMARAELMHECVRRGAEVATWSRAADVDREMVYVAAKTLSTGGRNLDCAHVGFRVLHRESVDDVPNRWGALKGLHSTLLAMGRIEEATVYLDEAIASDADLAWASRRFHILGALVAGVDPAKAEEAADRYRSEIAQSEVNANNLWTLAMWEAARGRADAVELLGERVDVLESSVRERVSAAGAADPAAPATLGELRRLDLIRRSIAANLALARGDSAAALESLESLRPNADAELLQWHFFEPLGLDQLTLAKLLVARGRYAEALTVADAFDSPAPLAYLLYLPESLRVRIAAAEGTGRPDLAERYRERLVSLTAS